MDRRSFLASLGLAGTGSLLPGSSLWASDDAAADAPRLIVVLLRGAVDGLSVVVPYSDDRYYQSRSSIAIARPGKDDGALDLDGQFGLHPACAALLPLWQSNKLAFIHASGSPDPSRSHFDAQDFMETAMPGVRRGVDGWMNRALAQVRSSSPAAQALSSGVLLPQIGRGPQRVTAALLGSDGGKAATIDQPAVEAALDRLYADAGLLSDAYHEARVSHDRILADLGAGTEADAPDRGAPLPSGFALEASQIATLMRRNPALRLSFTQLGGWDTHVRQGGASGYLAGLLKPLADGLALLVARLQSQFDNTLIVVMSEFGRTLRQNGAEGTDHGHGNAMWLIGGKVGGGKVYGEWPGLDDAALYEQRDLAITTDFRTVLARIGEQHLRFSDQQLNTVFPKAPSATAKLDGLLKA